MDKKRGSFSNKMGFVLAAAGSAVGLGNLWRFPYLAAKYGGGIFLLVYLILAVTLGFTLMITEIAIGRKTGLSAIGAFKALDKRFNFVGYLACVVPFIITPYYCVIGCWVVKYFAAFLTGQGSAAAGDEYFNGFISQATAPVFWFALYILLTAVVVIFGVEKGIEKASRIMMPLLIVLIIGVSIFCITRPGAGAGVKYYLLPDFSRFSATTVLAAMGQLFYSMSLAMGIMITYGSYMKKDSSLEQSVRQIEIFDTVVAFLAGLMIIPSVFVFSGGDEAALGKGPSLMFVTLPKVFESMSFGGVIGAAFFLLVLFAALTSSISLMETNVSIVRDKFGWSRKKSTLIITLYVLILGSIVSLGFGPLSFIKIIGLGLLDFFDFLSNSVLMPIVAILTCVCIGHFIGSKTVEDEVEINGPFKVKKFYRIMLKWIAPICLVLILIFAVSEAMGWIKV
ncbi:sodium-dependent transporter [Blautia hansenii]|uniref:Transporter n=1 Tax=Blautia hansenii TaxID=1322 RepID=A0ABX2I7N4_BLAHA|nr:sodium-dependent transporter [Blautia hansenii]MCB5599654.1 sodium-dependent transporter [Blautia hansenii]NSJ85102.1 sodium-dependent transporter [Blautia hansenii]